MGADVAANGGGSGEAVKLSADALAVCMTVCATEDVGIAGAEIGSLGWGTEAVVVSVVLSRGAVFPAVRLARFWARFFDAEPIVTEQKGRINSNSRQKQTEDRKSEVEQKSEVTAGSYLCCEDS